MKWHLCLKRSCRQPNRENPMGEKLWGRESNAVYADDLERRHHEGSSV
jgi:hypothetical protein